LLSSNETTSKYKPGCLILRQPGHHDQLGLIENHN
jgi:hypothetical protein